jgi:hypothetical protein
MCNIERFLDMEGRIKQLPSKGEARRAVLTHLAEKFYLDREYTEKEVNTIIDTWHTFGDYFLLRRELVENQFLCRTRDGARYWKEKN